MYTIGGMHGNFNREMQQDMRNYSSHKQLPLEYIISSIAGSGIKGYSGDGEKAALSKLFMPYGVAVDSVGNIYIADSSNHCIRKVLMPLLSASINQHKDTFVDKKYIYLKNVLDGTIAYYTLDGSEPTRESPVYTAPFFITHTATIKVKVHDPQTGSWSDTTSTTYKKVNEEGRITTIAGNGIAGYSGDGGKAIQSRLNYPKNLAVDSTGNVYIADTNNHCIRKIDLHGRIITVAGIGKPGYSGDGWIATMARLHHPNYLTIDNQGNLYISDSFNNCIRKVDSRGIISTIAGSRFAGYSGDGGHARYARFRWPNGIAVDKYGSIFIADSLNHCIRKVDRAGMITTIAGNNKAGYSGDGDFASIARLDCPQGITVDIEGNLYICDNNNNCIRKIYADGKIVTVAGTGMVGYSKNIMPAMKADLNMPYGIAVDTLGNFYIADTYNNCIRKARILYKEYVTLGETFQ